MEMQEEDNWRSSIINYFKNEKLYKDDLEAKKVRILSPNYVIMVDKLYKMGRTTPMLR